MVMSFIPCTEKKLRRKQLEFVRFYAGSETGPGSVIPEADPRIRIRIKMKRIRNAGSYAHKGK